jgi:hypothetical protein
MFLLFFPLSLFSFLFSIEEYTGCYVLEFCDTWFCFFNCRAETFKKKRCITEREWINKFNLTPPFGRFEMIIVAAEKRITESYRQ